MKTLWKSLACVGVMSLLAACGGGGDGSSSGKLSASTPTAKAAKADHDHVVCAQAGDVGVQVISDDPIVCAAVLFECEPGQVPYNDECGCGCLDQPLDPIDPIEPVCPQEGASVFYLSHDPLECAAALFVCEPGQTVFNDECGCGCIGEPEPNRCERATGDACDDDSDCVAGGCGGELCYNPALSDGISTCDCVEPPQKGCGCVNHVCAWN